MCDAQLLLDPLTDSYETWRVYTIQSLLLQRQLFDFRFRPHTGSGLFFGNRKFKTSQQAVKDLGNPWTDSDETFECTLKSCIVTFSTSGRVLKTGNWNFPDNPTLVPCNIFRRFLIFPKLKHFQIDSKLFRMPQA